MQKPKFDSEVEAVDKLAEKYNSLHSEIKKVIIGQDEVVKNVLLSIFSKGHCLLIGVPGLAKTLLVSTIARSLDLKFSRIQFTPDLMPSDITGSEILDESRQFKFVKGPVFANIILADEINRTPPKTQSALLEAMQEKSVTAAGNIHKLEEPFFVLATQNPIEQEGTYPLPEAQLDRFMFNIILDYPSLEDEINVVKETTGSSVEEVNKVLSGEEIIEFQKVIRNIPVPDNVLEYAVKLTASTRPDNELAKDFVKEYVSWGAGTRAGQFLILGAKTNAVLNGKYSPDQEDVNQVAKPVLRHRILRNYKAEAEGIDVDKLIDKLIDQS